LIVFRVNWILIALESALLALAVCFIFIGPRCAGQMLLPGTYIWILQVYIASVAPWIAKAFLTCCVPTIITALPRQWRDHFIRVFDEQQQRIDSPMCGLSLQDIDLIPEYQLVIQVKENTSDVAAQDDLGNLPPDYLSLPTGTQV
jgi:hypothetical protein